MYNDKKILAIIPARGGSKGIPRKNVRFLQNKPLIAYCINTALSSDYIDDVIVTTDDEEIANISRMFGIKYIVDRPKKLAEDATTLDPVIYHAYIEYSGQTSVRYDCVITLQPTSPLLRSTSIDSAIEKFYREHYHTVLSVEPIKHLFWIKKEGELHPFYPKRLNRQQLDAVFFETGGFLITKTENLTSHSRISEPIGVFELPEEEAIDIDTQKDWFLTEQILNRKKILLRVDGDHKIGMGHVYRMITIANELVMHDITFVMNEKSKLGVNKVKSYNYNLVTIPEEKSFFDIVENEKPDIIMVDILDTELQYISKLKQHGALVVSFEDLGMGAKEADIVFNAIYEYPNFDQENFYSGHQYICLREEFRLIPTKKIKENIENILITFGGTDQNNLTFEALKAIQGLEKKDITITIVLGLGYRYKDALNEYVSKLQSEGYNIEVFQDIKFMSKFMYNADIAITSNGRTVFEVASIGVPTIVIAQNERETKHTFSKDSKGIEYLGLADEKTKKKLKKTITKLSTNTNLRKEMNRILTRYDLKYGIKRIINKIFEKYHEKYPSTKLNVQIEVE